MDDIYLVVVSEEAYGTTHVRRMEPVPLPGTGTLAAAKAYLQGTVWPDIIAEKPSADPASYRVDFLKLTNIGNPWA